MDNDQVKQEQRTFLRERFLRMLGAISGKKAEVTMVQKSQVSATLGPSDIEFESMQVSDLYTPLGLMPAAVLRTSDIVSIRMENYLPHDST